MFNIKDIVCDSNGLVDVKATLANAETSLNTLRALHENVVTRIDALFTKWHGFRITMPNLKNAVVASFELPPGTPEEKEASHIIQNTIVSYIEANKDVGTGFSLAGEVAIYNVAKGKGGGIGRVADLPVKMLPAAVKAEKAAAKELAKAEKAAAKEAEKVAKKAAWDAEKAAKLAAKEAEKAAKIAAINAKNADDAALAAAQAAANAVTA
jgi:hypothetical protein